MGWLWLVASSTPRLVVLHKAPYCVAHRALCCVVLHPACFPCIQLPCCWDSTGMPMPIKSGEVVLGPPPPKKGGWVVSAQRHVATPTEDPHPPKSHCHCCFSSHFFLGEKKVLTGQCPFLGGPLPSAPPQVVITPNLLSTPMYSPWLPTQGPF